MAMVGSRTHCFQICFATFARNPAAKFRYAAGNARNRLRNPKTHQTLEAGPFFILAVCLFTCKDQKILQKWKFATQFKRFSRTEDEDRLLQAQ